ncbi:MAG: HD domain-containing protein [Actinobacteria bacterium]|nr:MAG: HD domain-containing protein [Actinomycetota bacterium]
MLRDRRARLRGAHHRALLGPPPVRAQDHDRDDSLRPRRRVRGVRPRRGTERPGRAARSAASRAAGDDPEPAARRHGLLDHTVSVAQAVSASASAFPGIERDIAVTGALLHDLGKTMAYNDDPLAIDLTDAGRLQGEIPLGYYLVRREIERIEGFDPELAQAIFHIVLSHHGTLENGSPVIPATREATLVHAIDNLGGKLGSFDRIERALPDGEAWSRFDRGIDSAAYFRSRAA